MQEQSLTCQTCGKPCDTRLPCAGCHALYYCCIKHMQLRQQLGHDQAECSRMRKQLQRSQEICRNDLQWPVQVSAHDICKWLQGLQCHNLGLLQHCCPIHSMQLNGAHSSCNAFEYDTPHQHLQHSEQQQRQRHGCPPTPQHTGPGCAQLPVLACCSHAWQAAWAVQDETLIPPWTLDCQSDSNRAAAAAAASSRMQQPYKLHTLEQPCSTWADYYCCRGMSLTSPAALALQVPVTLWHLLVHVLLDWGWELPEPGQSITIIYLGAQVELLMLPMFMELAMLLPNHHIDLHMVGPRVPDELHGQTCEIVHKRAAEAKQGGITVSCWAGCFHSVVAHWQQSADGDDQPEEAAAAGHMIGPSQQPAMDTICTAATVTVCQGTTVCNEASTTNASTSEGCSQARCCRHEQRWRPAAAPTEQCHLVFAANAGLPAYADWLPSLQQLFRASSHGHSAMNIHSNSSQAPTELQCMISRNGKSSAASRTCDGSAGQTSCKGNSAIWPYPVPVLFTDYCEEAAEKSQQLVKQLVGQGFDLECYLNPFRQPVPASGHGTRLPACSNCVAFGWL
eukprot:GHRR01008337.1.p1 GENE.GHRR01008337.1~~GHRR01008337.1.p1  ORF type:complete len:564 (+),score=163.92 GHRR01008337.1:561-2252(+)